MEKGLREVLTEEFSFWEKLSDTEREKLLAGTTRKEYEKGGMVHSASEKCLGLILVEQGRLRVYVESEEGRDVTLYRLEPGDICTLSASCFMNEITFEVMIEAETDSRIVLINPSVFQRITAENIYAENYLYKQTASHFSDVMWAMQQIMFKGLDQRLAEFLFAEAERTGSDTIRMTHEQIAQHISSAREAVARMLKSFSEDGLVELKRGAITLRDKNRLNHLK